MYDFEFAIHGDRALFTQDTNQSGERSSYLIPTYEAIKGIIENIYWKPPFIPVVDSVRIMNIIQYEKCRMVNELDTRYNTH